MKFISGQRDLGRILHKIKINRSTKGVSLLQTVQSISPSASLSTTCNSFITRLIIVDHNFTETQINFNTISSRLDYFKNSFIPCIINECNMFVPRIPVSNLYKIFQNVLLGLIGSVGSNTDKIATKS